MNAGTFLNSTALLDGSFFEKAVIFITEHNEKGATGFVVNKLFPRKFNELAEFSHSKPFPLYDGGPVDQEHLYFIHRRPDLIDGSTLVADGVYFGGDFKEAVMHMDDGALREEDIRLFIGYCGWDVGELEAEIAEGSWLVTKNAKLL